MMVTTGIVQCRGFQGQCHRRRGGQDGVRLAAHHGLRQLAIGAHLSHGRIEIHHQILSLDKSATGKLIGNARLYGLPFICSTEGPGVAIAIRRILIDGWARPAIVEALAASVSAMKSRRFSFGPAPANHLAILAGRRCHVEVAGDRVFPFRPLAKIDMAGLPPALWTSSRRTVQTDCTKTRRRPGLIQQVCQRRRPMIVEFPGPRL